VSLPRPAIVATVRDAADVLGSFIAYHLAIGFAHIYLFFDDPADPFAGTLDGHPQVTPIRCDAELRSRWPALRSFRTFGAHVDTEVMARQILNCELAIGMAAQAGMDWMLHIDSDELFFCEGNNAPEHFRELDSRGTRNAVYMNFEALPETLEVGDYFRDVTLFKVNINRLGALRFDARQMTLLRAAHFTDEHFNFHLYNNGKAAARIDADLVPVTVHEFGRVTPAGTLDRQHEICGDSQLILHYPNCGFPRFLTKYRTLGEFGDRWFGVNEIFRFHREARDIVALGDEARARQFYRDRVMLNPAEDVALLIEQGLLKRIDGPARLLASLRP
jgi:hypothetical protein